MRSSCAMMASSITPPLEEEEGAEVDGMEWARVRGHFSRSWASLRRTDAALMAPRLEIGNRGMANDPRDSRRKDKLITSCRILIGIYNGENEIRGKVYSKVLSEGKQKASTRLSNGVIVRQWMENKSHHHIKELQTFCKART